MAHPVQVGVPYTILHAVRKVDGSYVAGQAGAVEQELLGPDRAAAAEVATLTDHATGWVAATITLTGAGSYLLTLTNPDIPVADGNDYDYELIAGPGIASGAQLLTSLDRIRTRLQLTKKVGGVDVPIEPGDAHPWDDLLNLIISEVSDEYQNFLGRTFAEQAYTLYLDGTGRSSLVLGVGPMVSVTSINAVAYEDDGAGGVTETLTLLAPHTYVIAGQRSQPRFTGLGRIDLIGGSVFTPGARNYKVACTAGFSPIPEGVVGLATEDTVTRLMTRQTGHLVSISLGDGTTSYLRPAQMQEMRERRLAPYLLEAA
jgi:hypothetical protein